MLAASIRSGAKQAATFLLKAIEQMFDHALSLLKNYKNDWLLATKNNFDGRWMGRKPKRRQVVVAGVGAEDLAHRSDWTATVSGPDSQNLRCEPAVSEPPVLLQRPMAARAGLRAAFALALGLVSAALAMPFGAGLLVSVGHVTACVVAGLGRAAGRPLASAAGCVILTVLLLVEPAALLTFLCGVGLGVAAWTLAFWEQMEFLDDAQPWFRLRHQIEEALNVFISNDPQRWNRMYSHGQWEFLHGAKLAPLYGAAADFLRLRAPAGARVVDLGCGNGALLPALRGWHQGYLGIDLSSEAVAGCSLRLGFRGDEAFRVGRVEDFAEFANFEAAVFNEMLYYLSVARATAAVRKAFADLRAPATVVVVMTDNPKARRIWAALDTWRAPQETRVFRIVPHEPVCEIRLYTLASASGDGRTPTMRNAA